ncbi:histone-lysine N-methyltransferase SETDB1-A [Nematolebias whitei]|uniref:histone-lysine N-methyltransferase SETDB1-A n=1 Tax=Nematolebias whitei TaxID=451745 RepID=UPI0018984B51|nr:histone-lysine N-methyltransferase SETDB1-A [Nematolebias whitei]
MCFRSVAECEKSVKELYSLLEWEYNDEDSGAADAESTSCRPILPFLFVPSKYNIIEHSSSEPHSPQSSKAEDGEIQERWDDCESPIILKKEAVVVLTKLRSDQVTAALCPPPPQLDNSENESSANSETQWEPENVSSDSGDSEFSVSDFDTRPSKKRKFSDSIWKYKRIKQLSRVRNTARATRSKTSRLRAGTKSSAESNKMETTVNATPDDDAANNTSEAIALHANTSNETSTSESDETKTPQSNTSKTNPQANATNSTPQSNTQTSPKRCPVKTSTVPAENKTPPPKLPEVGITVNMNVLARRRTMCWKPGKITEIITKEDGKVKYKVVFDEKGKSLVSSHHIALDCTPVVDYLVVGARVVVKCQDDQPYFKPGILAEVPGRKNRMRFLVFFDDHTPLYCGLPLIRLVCKPLADPLDDIPDENHRNYMRGYLNSWPYPLLSHYRAGQTLNIEYNGVQQKCDVLEVDSSLIYVVLLCDKQKEWVYRGSMRLEHMVKLRKEMLVKK